MRVLELWRYPIKSIGGERLDVAEVAEFGIVGDRGWGLVDEETGNVLTARRAPTLLMATCACLLYTSPSPRDATLSRMPSSA